jgi:hypothetical protein
MNIGLFVAIGFVVLFYRVAVYEHMTGWVWAVASFALSIIVMNLWGGLLQLFVAQVGLFMVLWAYNAKRVDKRHQEWATEREARRREQEARMRRAQEEIKRDREKKEAEFGLN